MFMLKCSSSDGHDVGEVALRTVCRWVKSSPGVEILTCRRVRSADPAISSLDLESTTFAEGKMKRIK